MLKDKKEFLHCHHAVSLLKYFIRPAVVGGQQILQVLQLSSWSELLLDGALIGLIALIVKKCCTQL